MFNRTKSENVSGIISQDIMDFLQNKSDQRKVSEPVSLNIRDKIAEDKAAYEELKNMMSIPGKIGVLDSNCSTGKTYAALKIVKELGGLTVFVVPTNAQMKQLEKEYEGCRIITSQVKESARKTKKALYSTDCRIYVTNPELVKDVIKQTAYLFQGCPSNIIIDEAHTCLFNMSDYRSKGMQDLIHVMIENARKGSNVLLMSGTPEPFSYIVPDRMLKIHSMSQNIIRELKIRILDRKDNDKMTYSQIYANELLSIMKEHTAPVLVSLNDEIMTDNIEQILKSYNICTGRINQYTVKNDKDRITRSLAERSMLPRRNESGRDYQVIFATSSIEAGINIKENPELNRQYIPVLISPKADNANVESEVQFFARLRYQVSIAFLIKKSADKKWMIGRQTDCRKKEYYGILAMQDNVTVNATRSGIKGLASIQDSIDQSTAYDPNMDVTKTDTMGRKTVDYFFAWYLAVKNVERKFYADCNHDVHMDYLKEKLNIGKICSAVVDYSNADRFELKEMHRDKESRKTEKKYRQEFAARLQNEPDFRKDFINCNMENEEVARFVLSEKSSAKELLLAIKFGKETFRDMTDAVIEGSNKRIRQVHFNIIKSSLQDPCTLTNIINLDNNKSSASIIATSPLGDTLYQLAQDPIVKDVIKASKAYSMETVIEKVSCASNHEQLRNSFRRGFIADMVNEYRMGNTDIRNLNLATAEIGTLIEALTYRDKKDGRLYLNRSQLTEQDYQILADELNATITDRIHKTYTADMIKAPVSQIMDVLVTEQALTVDELMAQMETRYRNELTVSYYTCKQLRQKELQSMHMKRNR